MEGIGWGNGEGKVGFCSENMSAEIMIREGFKTKKERCQYL
jgi:hypothetical protein